MANFQKLTPRSEDYSKWYNELVVKADLAEQSAVRGCMVIKPYGYAIHALTISTAALPISFFSHEPEQILTSRSTYGLTSNDAHAASSAANSSSEKSSGRFSIRLPFACIRTDCAPRKRGRETVFPSHLNYSAAGSILNKRSDNISPGTPEIRRFTPRLDSMCHNRGFPCRRNRARSREEKARLTPENTGFGVIFTPNRWPGWGGQS